MSRGEEGPATRQDSLRHTRNVFLAEEPAGTKVQGLSMEEGSEARTQTGQKGRSAQSEVLGSEKASSGLSWKQDGKTLRGAGQQESVSQEVPSGLSRMDGKGQQWELGA